MAKSEYICHQCSGSFLRYASTVRNPERVFCSRRCSTKWIATNNNPNKGKLWSEEKKKAFSQAQKIVMSAPSVREKCGAANRGKKFSSDRIHAMHGHRSPDSYSHAHSPETRKILGQKSAANWLNEKFKKRVIDGGKKTKAEKGLIVRDDDLDNWKLYWRLASWASFDYANGLRLQESNLVRDHVVGRKQGFDNGIFPEILKHPENCNLISPSENSKKARRAPDPAEIEKLFSRILSYDGHYPTHHRVVELVQNYKNGERWKRRIG